MDAYYHTLMFYHLWTVVPAFFIGTLLIIIKKGTQIHRKLGRVYMVLMLITAFITLLMPAHVGPRLFNHLGYIHFFSFLTLYLVPGAYFDIKKAADVDLEGVGDARTNLFLSVMVDRDLSHCRSQT